MNKTEFFKLVKKYITVVRLQGSPPSVDLNDFSLKEDRYMCDLCKQPLTISRFTQCGLCGRWICKEECWNEDHSVCGNCAGVIKLMKESFIMAGVPEDRSREESLKDRFMGKLGLHGERPVAETSGASHGKKHGEKEGIESEGEESESKE